MFHGDWIAQPSAGEKSGVLNHAKIITLHIRIQCYDHAEKGSLADCEQTPVGRSAPLFLDK